MKAILRSFINGVLTIVPIILVVYVVFKTFIFLDNILGNVLRPYLKEDYIRDRFSCYNCSYYDSRVDVYKVFNRKNYSATRSVA